jgi:hypothetical protein
MLTMKLSKYWLSANHQEFELLSTYTQDDVVWARYRDILNDRQYHCHLEAFLQRFYPSVD